MDFYLVQQVQIMLEHLILEHLMNLIVVQHNLYKYHQQKILGQLLDSNLLKQFDLQEKRKSLEILHHEILPNYYFINQLLFFAQTTDLEERLTLNKIERYLMMRNLHYPLHQKLHQVPM